MGITCQIRRWRQKKDGSWGYQKVHGPGAATRERDERGLDADQARALGWHDNSTDDRGFWAQPDLPLGSDPVEAVALAQEIVAAWLEDHPGEELYSLEIDFQGGG